MNKKETIKHFYEVIVSNNLLNELPQYVSENCVLIDGERKIPLGLEGMKEHLTAVTYQTIQCGYSGSTKMEITSFLNLSWKELMRENGLE